MLNIGKRIAQALDGVAIKQTDQSPGQQELELHLVRLLRTEENMVDLYASDGRVGVVIQLQVPPAHLEGIEIDELYVLRAAEDLYSGIYRDGLVREHNQAFRLRSHHPPEQVEVTKTHLSQQVLDTAYIVGGKLWTPAERQEVVWQLRIGNSPLDPVLLWTTEMPDVRNTPPGVIPLQVQIIMMPMRVDDIAGGE